MMKKTALYLLVLPLFIGACKSKCVEDSGIHSVTGMTVKPFDQISVKGPVRLVLRQDSSFKIDLSADSSLIGLVKAEVSGHTLEIKLDSSRYCGKDSVIINAGIGDLKKLEASGAGHVYTASRISVNDLEMKLSGATRINLELNAAKLLTSTDGDARINLSGQAGTHQLKSKGNLNMEAFDFVAGIYDLQVDGVGKLKINVLNELKVKTSGATEIFYKGNPKKVDEKKSGTAKLEKVE